MFGILITLRKCTTGKKIKRLLFKHVFLLSSIIAVLVITSCKNLSFVKFYSVISLAKYPFFPHSHTYTEVHIQWQTQLTAQCLVQEIGEQKKLCFVTRHGFIFSECIYWYLTNHGVQYRVTHIKSQFFDILFKRPCFFFAGRKYLIGFNNNSYFCVQDLRETVLSAIN